MTIVGFHKTDGHLFVWSDSEVVLDGTPCGHVRKLGVSPGGLVGIGTGYQTEVTLFRDHVEGLGMISFEAAVGRLAPTLRAQHRDKRRWMSDHDRSYSANSSYALAGWSSGACAVVFYESRDFEPVAADAWSSTSAGGLTFARSASDVLAHAQRQLSVLRKEVPNATGGDLIISKIGPLRTVRQTMPLLI
jgi:hypothetical protein